MDEIIQGTVGKLEGELSAAIDMAAEGVEKLSALSNISSGVIVAALVLLFLFILSKPLRLVLKIALNTGLGFVALIIINLIGEQIGVSLGVNWVNAVVVGVLGIPGVALLFFIKWMMLL